MMKSKRKTSRILTGILTLLVLLCMMTGRVQAASAGNKGVTATLTFNKSVYLAGEEITAILTMKNENPYPVENIRTRFLLPEGVTLASETGMESAVTLAAGEEKQYAVKVLDDLQIEGHSVSNPIPVSAGSYNGTSAKTGDMGLSHVMMVLALVSVGVGIGIIGKKKKGYYTLMLCIGISAILISGGLPSRTVMAAGEGGDENRECFMVEETIQIAGRDFRIQAEISYDVVETHSVTVTNGSGTGTYAKGEKVTITADSPAEGMYFAGWQVKAGGVTLSDVTKTTTTFVMGKEAVSVQAVYEVNTYTIEVQAGKHGTVTPKDGISVKHGEDVTFTFTPDTGYLVGTVTVDNNEVSVTGNSYTLTNITKPHRIAVTFIAGADATTLGSSAELESVLKSVIAAGETDLTVKLPEGASIDWFTAVKNAINTGTGIRLTLQGFTLMPDAAFQRCTGLTDIDLPINLEIIGAHAFDGCSNLTSIKFPYFLHKIMGFAFIGCSSINSIDFPDYLTYIGEFAFEDCTSLTSIKFACSVILDKYVFQGCTGLTEINNLMLSVIEEGTFRGCTGLTEITLPQYLQYIKENAFEDCTSLTTITYEGTMAQWNAISKDPDWDSNTGTYTIICTDGTIQKS